ncbi:MAG: hypothetical protein WA432_01870 [Candidatus Babeliaceae bacterium]
MKKLIFFFFVVCALLPVQLLCWIKERDGCFTGAFSAGYVFKHDRGFKEVYGHGIANVLTGDGCYYFSKPWGIGAKISYWRAKGQTTSLKQCTLLQEVPITVYIRGIEDFRCGLQLYISLGGGIMWMQEKSYLGKVKLHKGIGEVELGLHYPVWRCLNITTAFRYLFPSQFLCGRKADIGGFDIRAGFEFPF